MFPAFQRSETFSANVSHSPVFVRRGIHAVRSLTSFSTLFYFWIRSACFFYSSFYLAASCCWSRLRNSAVLGQLPLRSRQCPLGLTTLSPESRSKVHASNFSLEVAAWFAEQILRSPQLPTFFLLSFRRTSERQPTGPASPWVCT